MSLVFGNTDLRLKAVQDTYIHDNIQNFYIRYFWSSESPHIIYNLRTFSTDRNFTGKAIATQLTDTSYQCQLLQDTFALIQLSVIIGTVSEWKFYGTERELLPLRPY